MSEHKLKIFKGFTAMYNCNKLVYLEDFQWIQDAIVPEKQLKAGSRQKKIDLIIADNPLWNDLSDGCTIDIQSGYEDSVKHAVAHAALAMTWEANPRQLVFSGRCYNFPNKSSIALTR